ncbi:hypothetical protein ACIRNU_34755 [Streptomyces rochei]|uniref:hypothetical protein n=1 Tax=Streptomyces rochei TaxID=1928 RepID=UPI0037F328DE
MTDQTTPLRDRIARAIYASDWPNGRWEMRPAADHERYLANADAVLAVLPATTDQTAEFELRGDTEIRAAVLHEAADALDAAMARFFAEWPDEPSNSPYALGQKDAAAELRRMADETQPAETVHAVDIPALLEATLTERYTELGNPFSEMRRREQGPDGWPASHPVGPRHVAEVLRELLATGARQDGADRG